MLESFAENFGLVGGTAIALHIGHRRSVDFDLFTNLPFETLRIREKIAQFKVKPTVKTFASLSSSLDKAAKSNLFHPNKSARLKSRLSKFLVANNK